MRTTSDRVSTNSLALPEAPARLGQLATLRWSLLATALALAIVGLITVRSASAQIGADYFSRQLVWLGAGLVAMLFAFAIDYQKLLASSVLLYAAGLAALLLVLPFGHRAGGAVGWFRIGSIGVQPSEFAKLATAILLARYLSAESDRVLSLRQIAVVLGIAGLPMAVTALQPDLGGAAMFVPMVAGTVLVAGVRLRWIATVTIGALAVGTLVWFFAMHDYQRERVRTFLEPSRDPLGAGYQAQQSKIAVGSGRLTGRGYRQGTQSQLRFLPAKHTDFILAVLAEERGFVGVGVVLGLYGALLAAATSIAQRARDRGGIVLVVALSSIVAFHVLYNAAMVVGLVPITGIPLPFLSYGGSFTVVNWTIVGLLLNVDYRRHVNR